MSPRMKEQARINNRGWTEGREPWGATATHAILPTILPLASSFYVVLPSVCVSVCVGLRIIYLSFNNEIKNKCLLLIIICE